MSNMNPAPGQQMTQQDPGRTLGIVGLILAIIGSFVGLILSIIAFNQSKKAGFNNGLAKAGIIVGIITTVLSIVWIIFYVAVLLPQMQTQLGR